MEMAETSLACAHRELDEETGIKVCWSEVDQLGYRKFSKEGAGYFIYQFHHEPHLCPRNQSEICESGWFHEDEMRSMSCNRDVNSFLSLMSKQP